MSLQAEPAADGLDWDALHLQDFARRIDVKPAEAIAGFRSALSTGAERIATCFREGYPVEDLIRSRSDLVDRVILAVWRHFVGGQNPECALIAVGGYGRGELHPQSDIDLMVLLPTEGVESDEPVSRFLTFLWDIGLEVGHSVRTLEDCDREAVADVQILTTLLESRLMVGPSSLYEALQRLLDPGRMWSAADFFRAKVKEQNQRHHRYHDTAYNLEPNVKGSPGGLRDIQMIFWLARRHLGSGSLEQLLQSGFLTPGQLRLIEPRGAKV